jgi:hypothetical protein
MPIKETDDEKRRREVMGLITGDVKRGNKRMANFELNNIQPALAPINFNSNEPISNAGITRTLPSGLRQTDSGIGTVYEMGTRGTDGYGRVVVPPSFGENNRQFLQNLPDYTTATTPSGMEVSGSTNAVNRFMQPVAPPAQRNFTGRMIQAVSGSDYLPKKLSELEAPKYLGPESGLGWKTRAKLYDSQLDAYNKATGNQTALDIERMREAGAGQRSLAQANQWNIENQLNAKKIAGDLALAETQNKVGQLALLQEQNLQEARNNYLNNPTVENKNRLDRLLYDPKTQQAQADVRVIDQFSPLTGEKIGQTIMRDDGTGHYVDAMAPQQPQEHPAITYLRENDTPENRALFIKRYKKLPEGF